MATIYTRKGQPILVSDEDYDWLNAYTWHIGNGYAKTAMRRDGKATTVAMHRLIMNPPPHLYVDHINHCRADNRRFNLRLATHTENQRNQIGKSHYRYDHAMNCWVFTRRGLVVKTFGTKADARAEWLRFRHGVPASLVLELEAREPILPS
jgi:hypothetical protein